MLAIDVCHQIDPCEIPSSTSLTAVNYNIIRITHLLMFFRAIVRYVLWSNVGLPASRKSGTKKMSLAQMMPATTDNIQ